MNAKEIAEIWAAYPETATGEEYVLKKTLGKAYLAQSKELAEAKAALIGYGKNPDECVDDMPCVGHMAYIEVEAKFTALKERLKNPTEEMCVAGIGAVFDLGLIDTRVVRPVFKAMIDEANWKPNDGRKIDN